MFLFPLTRRLAGTTEQGTATLEPFFPICSLTLPHQSQHPNVDRSRFALEEASPVPHVVQ